MSGFGEQQEEEYDYGAYQLSSVEDDDRLANALRFRQASQYGLSQYPAYASVQGGVASEQQQTYYGNAYSDPLPDHRSWPQGANAYHGGGHQWSMHRSTYPLTGVADSAAYSSLFEGTDQAVQANASGYQFQNSQMSGENYGSDSATKAEATRYYNADAAAHMGNRFTGGSTLSYGQESHRGYGAVSQPNVAPTHRVHPAVNPNQGGLMRSDSTSGYSEGSTYALSTAGSAVLSPSYKQETDHEGDEESEGSQSPEEQGPPSPSTMDDPERKWKCKKPECAERKGFKRHADMMRHMSTVHHRGDQKFDCSKRSCPRKGEHGFTRKDHLMEHLRNFHLQEIPKRRGGRGRGRE